LSVELALDWEVLKCYARDLVKNERVPVDLHRICNDLHADIVTIPATSKPSVERTDRRAQIRLPRRGKQSSDDYNSWQRFVIAHELAHLILDRAGQVSTYDRSDYWKAEEVCNRFAGNLLLPDHALQPLLTDLGVASCSSLVEFIPKIAQRACVMWETVAYRISELNRSFDFLLIEGKRFLPDPLFVVRVSTLANNVGARTKLDSETALAIFLASINRAGTPVKVPPEVLFDSLTLRKLRFLQNVEDSAALRSTRTGFHVALQWKPVIG
jgi:hypothetical protein